MWEKYKSAIITGAVLCCIIFFGLGYCVGNTGSGRGRGQFSDAQINQKDNSGQIQGSGGNPMPGRGGNHRQFPQGGDGQQTPPGTNKDEGSQDSTQSQDNTQSQDGSQPQDNTQSQDGTQPQDNTNPKDNTQPKGNSIGMEYLFTVPDGETDIF